MHKKRKKNKTNYFTLLINLLEIWHIICTLFFSISVNSVTESFIH